MSEFKSPSEMVVSLSEWGMDPSTIRSMIIYSFGTAPSIKDIEKTVEYYRQKELKRKARLEKSMSPIGESNINTHHAMKISNDIFVRALWKEIKKIQQRMTANG